MSIQTDFSNAKKKYKNICFLFQAEWSYQWNAISSVATVDRGVELVVQHQRQNKSRIKMMFSNSETTKKIMFIANPEKRTRLKSIINALISSYITK